MGKIVYYLKVLVFLLFVSCATSTSGNPSVNRIDSGTQTDLSGYWNDTDVRTICKALINDCLTSPRVNQVINTMGGKTPTVLVGTFRNESSEHIDTSIISSIMEATIFNSGKMDFVAGGNTRNELRTERHDQQSNASEETVSSLANEIGADFMLFGTVRTIVDRAGNETIRTYFITAEMTNIETNTRMWMGQNNDIKKKIVRPKNKL